MIRPMSLRSPLEDGIRPLPRAAAPEGPSAYLSGLPGAEEGEAPMTVEFVGLTEPEKSVAIGGFPGGRRFTLQTGPRRT